MTKIIAFAGRKQSGKTTSGEYVKSCIHNDFGFIPKMVNLYSLADPLKQKVCMDILGLTYQQCYGSDKDKNTLTKIMWDDLPLNNIELEKSKRDNIFLTAREVMEIVGTRFFRTIFADVWIDALLRQIQQDKPDYAVILDVRFPNEVDGFLRENGIVIRLTADPFNSQSPAETALDPKHFDWKKFSYIVDNKHSTEEEKNKMITQILLKENLISDLT